MLRAYIDGSHNDDIEVVAAFVATDAGLAGFNDAWRAILDRYGLDHFHTTDYWARQRPFNRLSNDEHTQVRLDICQTLKNTRGFAFASIIWKNVYQDWRISHSSFIPADAHYFGIDRALRFVIHGINTYPVDDGVDIVCDTDKEHARVSQEMQDWHLRRLRQVAQRRPGHPDPQRPVSFSFEIAERRLDFRPQMSSRIARSGLANPNSRACTKNRILSLASNRSAPSHSLTIPR